MNEQMNLFASEPGSTEVPPTSSTTDLPKSQPSTAVQESCAEPDRPKPPSSISVTSSTPMPELAGEPSSTIVKFAGSPPASGFDTAVLSKGNGFLEGLNVQQAEAVITPANQALQVLAGAGTGKTELISRRFVKLVQDFRARGLARPAERLLVVTFTTDAALSMRERIQRRLTASGEEGLGPDAWIGTFHQFAMRLLRSHPLEVGLPPGFTILNTLEQQLLFNRVVHGMLAGDYARIDEILARYELELPGDVLSLEALQRTGIENIESLLDADGLYRLINRIKTSGLTPAEFVSTALLQTRRFSERLKTMDVPHIDGDNPIENIRLKINAWVRDLRGWAHADWDPAGEIDAVAQDGGKVTPGSYKDQLPGLARLYLLKAKFTPQTPDYTELDEALRAEEKLIAIIGVVYVVYQDALLSQGACDFDDLMNHAIVLLMRYPELRARYRAQFEAVIVDEFQDSNGSQLKLLALIMREGAENLTVVGDEKQSIYGFRFAQPENLDLIFRHAAPKAVNLQVNYRSRPPVLGVANALTGRITARANQQLQPCPDHDGQDAPPDASKVTWVDLDGELTVGEQKDLEARFIATKIARLAREGEARFSDIAVLVKSHAKAEAIQRLLADFGIPAIRSRNLGFFQENVIKDAMALLRLMVSLGDDLSLVRILQTRLNQKRIRDLMRLRRTLKESGEAGSLFEICQVVSADPGLIPGFPAATAKALGDLLYQLMAARKLKPRLSPVQLFLRLAKGVGIISPNTAEWQQRQQRISLRTFERMLYLFSQSRPLQPTLDEVVETLEQYADSGEELPVAEELSGEDAVRIMTVFKAKGLEFPVVFCAYTEKGQDVRGGDAIVFDPQYPGKEGFGLILSKVNGVPNLKREIYQKCWQKPRVRTEAQRVFYVALTRARHRLYVVRSIHSHAWTSPDDFPDQHLHILRESTHEDILFKDYWGCDPAAIRDEMITLQENQKVENYFKK